MTNTTEAIVTALRDGPATARDLSQRLDGIGYANIRQALRRLAGSGVVTKVSRGVYAVDCDTASEADRTVPDEDLRDRWEERAAIMEFDGGLCRAEAERLAWADVCGDLVPMPGISGWGGLAERGSSFALTGDSA